MEPISEAVLLTTTERGVTTLRLNRPHRRNALDAALLRALLSGLREAEERGDRAVVLTGGPDHFSSGGDVSSMPGPDDGLFGPASRLELVHELVLRIVRSDLVVVAAVEGYAVGAAWGVVLACDLVVAADDARFSAPFAARGLTADAGTAFHLPRRLGPQRAATHLLLGTPLDAPTAHRAGLVTEMVPAGETGSRSEEVARAVAHGPREATTLTKTLARQEWAPALTAFLEAERVAVSLAGHGTDAREGRAAFLERREPSFS